MFTQKQHNFDILMSLQKTIDFIVISLHIKLLCAIIIFIFISLLYRCDLVKQTVSSISFSFNRQRFHKIIIIFF